jgi:hypothetical protein
VVPFFFTWAAMTSMTPRYQTRRSAFENEVQVRASHPSKNTMGGAASLVSSEDSIQWGGASPERPDVRARRAQGEVRVEQNLPTNLKRLLFPG